ncbi:MAG: MFS transporter, partial [Thaumarchaeota archaeon]|nr:MFS transporter [Nitrososphaerota archaeon]
RLSIILTLLVVAQFVVILDFSIVQIALPTIRTDLGISLADSQWIVSAYGLTFAGLLLLSGRASDLYGRRKLFSIGLFIFALSSLAGGLAPSEIVLIGARAVQGVGAAIASATGLSLLVVSFPEGRERNRALSVFAAVSSAGFAAGVILGGTLTAALGWRSVFYVNVPIGIVAALLALRLLVESKGQRLDRRLDLPGAITVTAGLSLLVYALTNAANQGLSSFQTLASLALSAVVLASFLAIEHRSEAPLMPLTFLRRGTVLSANALAILTTSAVGTMIFLLTIYLQQIQGYSALSAGLAFLPTAIVFLFVGGYLSAKLVARFGMKPVLIVGMTIQAAGFLLLNRLSVGTPYLTELLPEMLVVSLGAAIVFTAFNIAALSGARRGEEGLASGLINTSRQVGSSVGLAIGVTIVSIVTAALGTSVSPASATVEGFRYAFFSSSVLCGFGIVIALLIRRPAMVVTRTEQAMASPAPPSPPTVSEPWMSIPIRKIMVAVDGSANGERAATTAIGFARDYHAELEVLRMVQSPSGVTPSSPGTGGGGSVILKERYDYAEKEAEDYVSSVVTKASSAGVAVARGMVCRTTEPPSDSIAERAKAEGVDMIVIGTRGLGAPGRVFLGSVSSGVVAKAGMTVVVVK